MFTLNRYIYDCPNTRMEDLWTTHDPNCILCRGSGKVPGPVSCSNQVECHENGYTLCDDCPVFKEIKGKS